MADEKWISGLHGRMSLADAARRILTVRLGVVRARLPGAVEHADEDIEHVHQLRVGTRRAGAALRILEDVVPAKLYRRTRRALRTVRRAAGAARDWDVFLEMVDERGRRVSANVRPGFDLLRGFGHGQRAAAQAELCEATAGAGEALAGLLDELTAALDEGGSDGTLRDLAVPMLTRLVEELEGAARGDLRAYEALHQVRILGKQVRYAMELFESCFAPAFREEVYPQIVAMQEILGRANDSNVATQRLDELRDRLKQTQAKDWPRYEPALTQLRRYHHRRLTEARRQFAKWWSAWVLAGQAPALERLLHAAG